jgi:hypothetical protein
MSCLTHGQDTQRMDAYKGTRAHNQEGNLEDNESKKSSAVIRQKKREISLKEPSRSTWEDLCYLEEDLVDRVVQVYFGMILRKSGNEGLMEACVRQDQNL